MQKGYSKLEPLTLSLKGEIIIEASAGTGKTFTIGLIYLRLLLGLGKKIDFVRRLSVEEILVVTFTEASAAELRTRIRSNIHELRIACIREKTSNPILKQLISQITNLPQAILHLSIAERNMHAAAIFTIHGFCQRILHMQPIESGVLFKQELLIDETPFQRQAIFDFWRRYCYPLPKPIARIVRKLWIGPEQLLQTLLPWLYREEIFLKTTHTTYQNIEQQHANIIERIKNIKTSWLNVQNIQELIETSGINRRSYNRKNLKNWLDSITQWAKTETVDYFIIKYLVNFSQSTLLNKSTNGEPPHHPIFLEIERFLSNPLSLYDCVITLALQQIRCSIQQEKSLHAKIGFHDLLTLLNSSLHKPNGKILAKTIQKNYPVALIDEFQDTDIQQYRIFHAIYHNISHGALLLIGDPKQAIYAFRGADIFTYMRARSDIKERYTLETNWRSSKNMVDAVNLLFLNHYNPFVFKEIPFTRIQSATPNHHFHFSLNCKMQPALKFCLQPGSTINISDYQEFMAQECAAEISHWLHQSKNGKAFFCYMNNKKPVRASDITILVRRRSEAEIVKKALYALNIPSVYLSNRDSIFSTLEAKEMLYLLQAILTPEKKSILRSSLSTNFLGIDKATIYSMQSQEVVWNSLIRRFFDYQTCWKKYGVLSMLRKLMLQEKIAENLSSPLHVKRCLTNLIHLGEVLQEASFICANEQSLINWLTKNIQKPNSCQPDQYIRLESNHTLVQIITIHKSKGLQYPLVWIPFAATFREAKNAIFYDHQTFTTVLDLQKDTKNMVLADQERLSEDLRLLYVALTRSIFHCSVGIAPLFISSSKKTDKSHLHRSAIGYLIQKGQAMNASSLKSALQVFNGENTAVAIASGQKGRQWQDTDRNAIDIEKIHIRTLSYPIQEKWKITSYSDLLQKHNATSTSNINSIDRLSFKSFDIHVSGNQSSSSCIVENMQYTRHTFPRGAKSGIFLHRLLSSLDFSAPLSISWLEKQIIYHGLNQDWVPVMYEWIQSILHTTLNETGVSLHNIPMKNRQVELKFYLPFSEPLTAEKLNKIMQQDPLSASCPPLRFNQIKGMLEGSIDLVFLWRGKYYLLDYKSHWFGESGNYYTKNRIIQAMQEHRYDLQYQLYTLALHRYLRHRLIDYDYQRHFGGIIYLFLRGVNHLENDNAVYNTLLHADFITSMDRL
ncbi:exodeoxyribonuclease V subunit beta [Candidatus Erwinia haradaeae]|uniref:RecBCD enzyme subunit RecB n=1 Tax=Candidatus Erwinia haradaeae TaxID=1922217 RepID=A0A451D447_9GAMM|nr:exodeoxyribonuclease V subunit beta [Candidatus Erwinia haradaeae]VFP80481.1 RecBCD enzyme subunit RecB [Candidatus Erwinia haradaeae]